MKAERWRYERAARAINEWHQYPKGRTLVQAIVAAMEDAEQQAIERASKKEHQGDGRREREDT